MRPFLYLDNWHAPQPETRFDRLLQDSDMKIEIFRTNEGEFPDHTDYCGTYVSPSFNGAYDDLPWIAQLHDLLPKLAQNGLPMIGLCFGCQVLAFALVGRDTVFKRAAHEGGRGTISLTSAGRTDPLTAPLPAKFDVYHWHGDDVLPDHQDIVSLADGPGCAVHLWRWAKGSVWGIQPHPEMNTDDLKQWFGENRTRFENKGHDVDGYISQCFAADEAFTILDRFLDRVQAGAKT